jgi:galactokinase/mevalonate kinase-like predicted kinase
LNQSWIQKKQTSSFISENLTIKSIDENLLNNPLVVAHKLCGAGNGGFFLTFSKKDSLTIPYSSVKINVSPDGVKGKKL